MTTKEVPRCSNDDTGGARRIDVAEPSAPPPDACRLTAENAALRETNSRLNRRAQQAEAGLRQGIEARGPGSLGRAAANASAALWQRDAELARAALRLALPILEAAKDEPVLHNWALAETGYGMTGGDRYGCLRCGSRAVTPPFALPEDIQPRHGRLCGEGGGAGIRVALDAARAALGR